MKSKTVLIYIIASLTAALLATIILLLYLQGKNNEKDKQSITSSNLTVGTSSIITPPSEAPIIPNEPSEVSSEEVLPSSTPASTTPKPEPAPTVSQIGYLDEETVRYLMTLDNTMRGWGQGVNYDNKNRPVACITSQENFGKYDALYIMQDEAKIYLTFDEGYENGYTAQILDALRDKNVSAVFFVTLPYAKQNPDLIRRMINEGHVVGNHSSKHLSFPSMSLQDAYNDINGLHTYIKDNFGYEMTLFRFPMGQASERMLALLQKMGYKSLFWSYAYADWDTAKQPDPADSLNKLTTRAHNGGLYLLHAVSATNTQILPQFIDNLRNAGYELASFKN